MMAITTSNSIKVNPAAPDRFRSMMTCHVQPLQGRTRTR